MKSYLADVNVWVAIAHDAHMHHERAREWFHQLDRDQAWFCRFTQMGLLRLLTNYKVMGDRARTQKGAWEIWTSSTETDACDIWMSLRGDRCIPQSDTAKSSRE
jgi:predicted nucleic acid-binding protein